MRVLESQLSAKLLAIFQLTVNLTKSQLIFFSQYYILVFFIQKISNAYDLATAHRWLSWLSIGLSRRRS